MKILFILFILSVAVFPWGDVGHKTVACIAESRLPPAVLQAVKQTLNGQTIAEAAVWPDKIKRQKHNTGPWHYINLPVSIQLTKEDLPRYEHSNGKHPDDNIITQINDDITLLKSGTGSKKERTEALSFLIHFIGDLHMPLRICENHDKGGNEVKVRYFSPVSSSNRGHVTNLHSLWDNLIEIKAAETPSALCKDLNKEITPQETQEWRRGTIEDWALESYSVSKDEIYPDLPAARAGVIVLPRSYHEKNRLIVDKQLEKAGIRLSKLLNEIFANK